MTRRRARTALLAALALAGCAGPRPVELPYAAAPSWGRFLVGDDIRAACDRGAPDRFRLVLNADHLQRIRTFDIRADGDGAVVRTRLVRSADVRSADSGGPEPAAYSDEIRLTPRQLQGFVDRLGRTGGFRPPPPGARLPASGYYWLVSGCREGRYFVTVYDYPSDRFVETSLPAPARAAGGTAAL